MSHRTRFLVALLVGAALLGSCALPDDQQPRVISAADAPLDLNQVPGAEAAETPEGDEQVQLYFVEDGLLDSVMRTSPDGQLSTAIELLLAGPVGSEARRLSTSIPSETELNSASLEGTTAILDLGCIAEAPPDQCGLLAFGGQDQLTIFAQIVCTATALRSVEGVRFLQEGEPQDAPTSDGTIQSPEAVSCTDYQDLLP